MTALIRGRKRRRNESLTASNLLWWSAYIIVAIWLQKLMPGLDALVPALIICLQDENKQQTAAFVIVCMIIQEGTGTLPFGASIIWYSIVIATYYVGGWFFMGGNLMFVIVLSIAMGVSRALIFLGMGLLQPLSLDYSSMYRVYALQVLLTPFIWALGAKTRAMIVKHAY